MQNQEKIIQAIAAYLENADWNWRLPASTSAGKIATEIATAIAPHLEAGAGWEDAPEWAGWRTVDEDGTITFWNMEPYRSDSEGNWKHQNARIEFKEIKYTAPGWENSLQKRPA